MRFYYCCISIICCLIFASGCSVANKNGFREDALVVLVEGDLQRLPRESLVWREINSPIYIRDKHFVQHVSDALSNSDSIVYIHKFTVPPRAVILLARDGTPVAGFNYSLRGNPNDSFQRCAVKYADGKYYLGEPIFKEEDVVINESGDVIGIKNAKHIPGFAEMLKPYLDPYL